MSRSVIQLTATFSLTTNCESWLRSKNSGATGSPRCSRGRDTTLSIQRFLPPIRRRISRLTVLANSWITTCTLCEKRQMARTVGRRLPERVHDNDFESGTRDCGSERGGGGRAVIRSAHHEARSPIERKISPE